MGGGDIKLAAGLGAYFGLKYALISAYLGFLAGGGIAIILLIFKRKGRQDLIPFGPAMIVGACLALRYQNEVWAFFFGY